jgi:hypothetical protein
VEQQAHPFTAGTARQTLVNLAESLVDRSGVADSPGWTLMRLTLDALPLDTETFALALNRLNNARAYWEEGETGAARYELRLLLGGL